MESLSVAMFSFQNMLIEKLLEKLAGLDQNLKKKTLAQMRKERLAFVGISLDNIIVQVRSSVTQAEKVIIQNVNFLAEICHFCIDLLEANEVLLC